MYICTLCHVKVENDSIIMRFSTTINKKDLFIDDTQVFSHFVPKRDLTLHLHNIENSFYKK